MKRITPIFILLTVLLATQSHAKSWRVNNALSPDQVDFNELEEAVNDGSVMSGDTIYVEGSSIKYDGGIIVKKSLTIIGPGYFLDDKDLQPTSCNDLPATINGDITFDEFSDGSYMTGISIDRYLYIENTSNITIERNRIGSDGSGWIYFQEASNNIQIKSNIICGSIQFWSSTTVTDFYILNNLILEDITLSSSSDLMNGMVINNTLPANGGITIEGSVIEYNYCGTINAETENQSIKNNIMGIDDDNSRAIVDEDNSNVISAFNDDSFSCFSDDWRFQGMSSEHGAYNGPSPYYSEGDISPANLPAWPVIFDCDIESYGDSTINVTLKVRTNK